MIGENLKKSSFTKYVFLKNKTFTKYLKKHILKRKEIFQKF